MKTNDNNLGICPVCGKGQIIEGTNKYNCIRVAGIENKSITVADICTFSFFKSYFDHELTSAEVRKLIETGKTDEITDLKRKDGTKFSAKLELDKENKVIKPVFPEKSIEYLNEKCPCCGGKVRITSKYFICENAIGEEKTCSFLIQKIIAKKELTKNIVEILIKKRKTDFIGGFKNSKDEDFETRLVLEISTEERKANITFNSIVSMCPKCKKGIIIAGTKAYGCNNYKNEEIKCDFTIWKKINGRTINPSEVWKLCENGQTEILDGFKTKDGKKYSGKLVLVDDFKAKVI
ncbi:MAG: topoisomerase C-terminal repeat-containing protein [Oscillospiraceae bacterium]|jgi:hypothetical protein|nr:topoisomerase C-terminal repeat-containing protein [Oscillospiraceae bacterium]